MIRLAVFLTVILGAPIAVAALVENSPLLADARLVYHAKPHDADYRLVKSGIKKVNNQWRASEERLSGVVERKTYLLGEDLSFRNALVMLKSRIEQMPQAQVLFSCEGLDCGSSNGWANEYLNIKQLYGLDVYQYYAALQGTGIEAGKLQAFYLVQRGNKRMYLQHDTVRLGEPRLQSLAQAEIVEQLRERQAVTVMVLPGEGDMNPAAVTELRRLVDLLNQQPLWHLRVVGHNFTLPDFGARRSHSTAIANQLRDQLLELGANPQQTSAYGIANLAPGVTASDRLELVVDRAPASLSLVD